MNYSELEMPGKGDRVVVGMSGGVDSTMALMILKEKGCIVSGVTMSVWKDNIEVAPGGKTFHDSCYSPMEKESIEECREFCKKMDVPYYVVDVSDEYERQVLEYFKSEYRAGRTPNPCVRCNRFIKFGALLAGIEKLGIEYDYFCTGHYARVVRGESSIRDLYGQDASDDANGLSRPPMVATAMDITKDQAYFLNRIPSKVLEKVRFPLAGLTKKEIFSMARERNLAAADKEESQDFIPSDMLDSLFSDRPSVPGDIIDLDGKVLGRHRGIEHYTIGQRRGLGVSSSEPLYVAEIDSKKNLVVLGRDSDLFCSALVADDLIWPADYNPGCPFEAMVKIRLASRPVLAKVEPYSPLDGETFNGGAIKITFNDPQRAVAPGQSVVLYRDGVTVCGGIIARAIK